MAVELSPFLEPIAASIIGSIEGFPDKDPVDLIECLSRFQASSSSFGGRGGLTLRQTFICWDLNPPLDGLIGLLPLEGD